MAAPDESPCKKCFRLAEDKDKCSENCEELRAFHGPKPRMKMKLQPTPMPTQEKGPVKLSIDEAERILGKDRVAEILAPKTADPQTPAPPCPKHPDQPQLQCLKVGKRLGEYMGRCRLCMKEAQAWRGLKTDAPLPKVATPMPVQSTEFKINQTKPIGKTKISAPDHLELNPTEILFHWTLKALPAFDPAWTQEVWERWHTMWGYLWDIARDLDGVEREGPVSGMLEDIFAVIKRLEERREVL